MLFFVRFFGGKVELGFVGRRVVDVVTVVVKMAGDVFGKAELLPVTLRVWGGVVGSFATIAFLILLAMIVPSADLEFVLS